MSYIQTLYNIPFNPLNVPVSPIPSGWQAPSASPYNCRVSFESPTLDIYPGDNLASVIQKTEVFLNKLKSYEGLGKAQVTSQRAVLGINVTIHHEDPGVMAKELVELRKEVQKLRLEKALNTPYGGSIHIGAPCVSHSYAGSSAAGHVTVNSITGTTQTLQLLSTTAIQPLTLGQIPCLTLNTTPWQFLSTQPIAYLTTADVAGFYSRPNEH